MKTVHNVEALRTAIGTWRREGARIGFVPTMGNLHEGHLDLTRRARELADRVVVSVFVNPTQFIAGEDFERYPRTLAQDQDKLRGLGVDAVFAPAVDDIYPRGTANLTSIRVPLVSDGLEGEFRPGHFEGVATVVNILFNLVQPDVAVFGDKDYQQLLVVTRMAADLHLPVQVIGHPTRREPDGLAMSSRNQYLTADERRLAPALHRTLVAIGQRLRAGERDFDALSAEGMRVLEHQGFRPQYLAVRSPQLQSPGEGDRAWQVLAAAYLGRTRLIDNLRVEL